MARTLSVRDVAEDLGLSHDTVERMVARGEIPSLRFGRVIKIPREEYEAWYRKRVEYAQGGSHGKTRLR